MIATPKNGQYTGPPLRKPTLYGPDGRPIYANPEHDDGFALPHVYTFASIISGAYNAYWHDRWDEALKHSRESALAMTRDASLQALVQERVLPTVNLKWHLEVEDERDLWQQAVRDGLQTMARGIPRLGQMKRYLLEGVWYGKYGSHLAWEWEERNLPDVQAFAQQAGAPATRRLTTRPRRALALKRHRPVNGDKIGHQHDGTPHVLVSASQTQSDIKGARLISTTAGGQGLVLAGNWRERFIIHQHMVDDADFMAAEEGERIHGVGIRHVVYWSWWLKQEFMEWMTRFFERSGLGVRVWYYEGGNPNSLSEVKTRAKEQDQNVNILVPIWPNRPGYSPGSFEVVDAPVAGAAALLGMIQYIDNNLERYIVGQTLSSGTEGSGLGGSGVAALHADTKYQLVAFDAGNLGETLTEDYVKVQQRWTYGHVDFPVRWVQNVDEFDPAEKLAGVQTAFSMGVDFREDEVRGLTGLSDPMPGDVTLNSIQAMAQQMAAEQVAQQGGDEYDGYGYEGDEEDGEWEGYDHPEHGPGLRHKRTGETRHGDEADEDDGPDANARAGEPWRYAGAEQLAPRLERDQRTDDTISSWPDDPGNTRGFHAGTAAGRQYLPKVNPLRPPAVEPKWEVYQAKSGEPAWRHNTTGLIHRGPNPPRHDAKKVHDQYQMVLNEPPRTQHVAQGVPEALSQLLPHAKIRDDELHRLIGAQPGLAVRVHANTWNGRPGVDFHGEGPHTKDMWRTLAEDDQGRLVMLNQMLMLRANAQRGGYGLKTLSSQAEHLAGLGVERIQTTAGRGSKMNGYKTWPKLGYDAILQDYEKLSLPRGLRGTVHRVSDLMKTPEGQAWWAKNGQTRKMTFDLTPGSRSWETLNAYRQSKGLAPVQIDAEKVHGARAARSAAVAHERWAHSLDNLGVDREAAKAEAARIHAAEGPARADKGHSPRDVWDYAYRQALINLRERQTAPLTAPASTLQPTAVNYERSDFDESKVRRDEEGRFSATARSKRAARRALVKLGEKAGGVKDWAKHWAGRIGADMWEDLDEDDKALAIKIGKLAHGVEHVAMLIYRKGEALAQEAARERGLPDTHVKNVGRILTIADWVMGLTVNFPLATGLTGSPLVGKAASYLPVASMAYIAYSTARNPILTLRAARRVLGRTQVAAAHMAGDVRGMAAELLKALAGSENPDWYQALVYVALDRTHDLRAALDLAAEAASKYPSGYFSRGKGPDRHSRGLFDEQEHPRDEGGRFAREPHEITSGEYADANWENHKERRIVAELIKRGNHAMAEKIARDQAKHEHGQHVSKAILDGLAVPEHVLKEYPHLNPGAMSEMFAEMAAKMDAAKAEREGLKAARAKRKREHDEALHGDKRKRQAELDRAAATSLADYLQELGVSEDTIAKVMAGRPSASGYRIDPETGSNINLPSAAGNYYRTHREGVLGAIAAGKAVPPEVLADYPDLAPDRHARKKDEGRWITIGATTGEDGKKHGGCPVFIRNGKIEKGPASLAGKPLNNLRGDPPAEWKERATAEGVNPRHLESLAKEMQRHHGEHATNRTQMLQHARKAAQSYGVSLQGLQIRDARGKLDASMIPHFDEIATSMAAAYPEQFGGSDAEDRLYQLLLTGNIKGLSDEDAYEQALTHLRDHASEEPDDVRRGDAFEDEWAAPQEEETAGVPFARAGRPAAYSADPSHEDALGGMGVGHSGRVGGVHVSRTRPDAWRVEGPSGHVEGDAAKVAAHIRQLADGRKLHGKRLGAALARAAAYDEPSFLEPDRLEANTRAFAGLPVGSPVVSVDHDAGSHGRIGRIVRDPDTGRNRVILDGESVYASNHVEPLDSALSWRLTPEERAAREAQRAAAPQQGSLFARDGLPTRCTAAEFWAGV